MSVLTKEKRNDENLTAGTLLRDDNLEVILAVTLVGMAGISALTPAFPAMAQALGVDVSRMSWLVTAYALPGIVLAPILGFLSDRYGRKRVLLASLAIFGIAGGAAAFMSSFEAILALRFVQGIGGAALFFLNITLIGSLYRGKSRDRALGYNSSAIGIGGMAYPLVGGVLAAIAWNYPFLVPLLALPVALAAWRYMRNPEPRNREPARKYWKTEWQIATRRDVLGMSAILVGSFLVLTGVFFTYLPVLLEESFGLGAAFIGVVMASQALGMTVASPLVARVNDRFPLRVIVAAAFALMAVALFIMPMMPSAVLTMLPVALYGAAQGFSMPCVHKRLNDVTDDPHRSTSCATYVTTSRIGESAGPILMSAVYGALGAGAVMIAGSLASLALVPIAYFALQE